ncbi:MAG: hypothetical protein WAM71_10530, partial [Candidatus Korobacteraceae bacterium]
MAPKYHRIPFAPLGGLMRLAIAAVILLCPLFALAQKFDVTIINRQSNQTEYTYVVPGYFSSVSNSNANCSGTDSYLNCTGSTQTTGFTTPAKEVSLHVRGATLTLQLPDGRLAVVNCESKFAERLAG